MTSPRESILDSSLVHHETQHVQLSTVEYLLPHAVELAPDAAFFSNSRCVRRSSGYVNSIAVYKRHVIKGEALSFTVATQLRVDGRITNASAHVLDARHPALHACMKRNEDIFAAELLRQDDRHLVHSIEHLSHSTTTLTACTVQARDSASLLFSPNALNLPTSLRASRVRSQDHRIPYMRVQTRVTHFRNDTKLPGRAELFYGLNLPLDALTFAHDEAQPDLIIQPDDARFKHTETPAKLLAFLGLAVASAHQVNEWLDASDMISRCELG